MSLKNKKSYVIISCLLIIGLLVSGVVTENAKATSSKIKVQTPPIPAALPLLWIQQNDQINELVDLDIKISADHQGAISLISKNKIDMMVTGVNVGAKVYNKGINLKLLNVNTWGIDYLLTQGFKADEWSDLKGKTLTLPLKGGPLDFLARYFLRENGVDPEKVEFVYRPLPNGARYFMAGKVDSILIPEPLVTVNLIKNKDAVLSMDLQQEWGELHEGDQRIPFVGLFVSEKYVSENPQKVKILNGLYMKGIEWVNNHPEKAAKLGEEHFDTPAKILLKSFDRVNLNYYSEDETRMLIDRCFNEMMDIYPELLGGKLPDEDFYY